MKRSMLFLFVATIAFASSAFAQEDLFLLPKKINYELVFPERDYTELAPTLDHTYKPTLHFQKPVLDLTPKADLPINRQVLSEAYRPFFDPFTPMRMRMSPMALDFDEYKLYPLSRDVDFVLHGIQQTYPGLGGQTLIQPAVRWSNDKFDLSGGAFGGRFYTPYHPSPDFIGGVNMQVGYQVADFMKIRAWGQYAITDQKNQMNPFLMHTPMMNHSQVGGAMEFKINDDFGIGMGVNYEFNPIKRKMEPRYMAYPIFY